MAGMTIAALTDLTNATLTNWERMKWTEIQTTIQRYVACDQLLNEKKKVFDGGTSLSWKVRHDGAPTARFVQLYEQDVVNVAGAWLDASIPWRFMNSNWALDLREPKINGATPEQIVDILTGRRTNAILDTCALLEKTFWTKPSSSTDVTTPFGVEYYVVYYDSATPAFNGGNPSGFTAGAAGISSSTYTRWANWTGSYVSVTVDDLIRKIRTAMDKTDFQLPRAASSVPNLPGPISMGLYTDLTTKQLCEELVEKRNDNLGVDLAWGDTGPTIRGHPVVYVPYLDAGGSHAGYGPVYGLDWGTLDVPFMSGWDMRESEPVVNPASHLVVARHTDSTFNMRCTDRRRNFLLAQSH